MAIISKNVPKFLWPAPSFGSNLTLIVPSPPWKYGVKTIGGGDTSAAGVPETFLQRTDDLADIVLRFREVDWPLVRTFVLAVQQGGVVFAWYPDYVVQPGMNFLCYLESPKVGETFKPEPDDYPGLLRLPLGLRFTTGVATADYFATPAL